MRILHVFSFLDIICKYVHELLRQCDFVNICISQHKSQYLRVICNIYIIYISADIPSLLCPQTIILLTGRKNIIFLSPLAGDAPVLLLSCSDTIYIYIYKSLRSEEEIIHEICIRHDAKNLFGNRSRGRDDGKIFGGILHKYIK